jgi:stress response protein YsnF
LRRAVTLHSERVSVERRPVAAGTPVTDADFTDCTIEVTETNEEAVVRKTARVKEEVVVNKNIGIRDSGLDLLTILLRLSAIVSLLIPRSL